MTEEQLLEDNLGSVQGKLIITRRLLKYRLAFAVRFCRLYAALFRQFFYPLHHFTSALYERQFTYINYLLGAFVLKYEHSFLERP
jgi:hypothetical protein